MIRKLTLLFCISSLALGGAEDWKKAEPGWKYEWPRDHRTHPEFKTEWWYFTGNLRAKDGRRFGYQLTFFRHGLRPPGSSKAESRFVKDDIQFGHFAMTDVGAGTFHYTQSIKRGAFGEAGFGGNSSLAWLGEWRLEISDDGAFIAKAQDGAQSLELRMESAKPFAIHGENGISSKAEEPGHASHYYSATRLKSSGHIRLKEQTFEVEGESWFDHEWATNQLARGQSGWDWFSIQFDEGSELMLYQLRREDGSIDGASSGSWIDREGRVRHLKRTEISIVPRRFWTSKKTGGKYPLEWEIKIESLGLALVASTPVEDQELVLKPVAYWEGLIDITGTRDAKRVAGHGYLELTGYAGALVGLMAPQ